jgi:hypothetical protein
LRDEPTQQVANHSGDEQSGQRLFLYSLAEGLARVSRLHHGLAIGVLRVVRDLSSLILYHQDGQCECDQGKQRLHGILPLSAGYPIRLAAAAAPINAGTVAAAYFNGGTVLGLRDQAILLCGLAAVKRAVAKT